MRLLVIKSLDDMSSSQLTETNAASPPRSRSRQKENREDTHKFRNSGPKSRNGCITCKIRRVKCGEEKPTCQRCTSTGRKCDGYNEPNPRSNANSKPRTPLPRLSNASRKKNSRSGSLPRPAVPRSPSFDIEGSLEERRSFHYFRSRNMSSMPGNSEPYFWDHLVLQFSHRDPTIRSSLVALGAIYEEHELHPDSTRSSAGKSESVYVLQQYTKALRQLADSLLTGQADPRTTLTSCLIFIWIEFLQNNLESGFKHLESGLQILRDLQTRRRRSGSGSPYPRDYEDLYGSLDRSFKRLSIQAIIHGRASSFDLDKSAWTNPWGAEQDVPAVFSNFFEARNYMDGMLNSIFVCMRQVRNSEKYGTADQVVDLLFVDSMCESFLERLEQWRTVTQTMLTEQFGALEKDQQPDAVAYLLLYQTYMTIILKTPFATSEMVFDGYTAEFARLIELAETLLAKLTQEGPPVLSFDMGIIPPLFLLVLKCRDIRLRRKALALLKRSPEQEGLWRRAAIVAFSEWKIDFEEQGRGGLPESSPLPESARIYQERVIYEIRDGKRVPLLSYRRSSVSMAEPSEMIEMSKELEVTMEMGNMV